MAKGVNKADLVVRRLSNNEEVHRVEVTNPFRLRMGIEKYEHVISGMLMQIDTERFFVDDSEIDKLRKEIKNV